MEQPFLLVTRMLPAALAVSVIGLLVDPGPAPLPLVLVHLSLAVGVGIVAAARSAEHADSPWLLETNLQLRWRVFWSAGMLVAFATGLVALVTLASSAALGYDPSLQFLQLLSALDIAWVSAATFLGLRWWLNVRSAWVGSIAITGACVWSIWNYLRVVGFTESGGWIVDGAALMRLVIPFDMVAAIVAIAILITGSSRYAEHLQGLSQSPN